MGLWLGVSGGTPATSCLSGAVIKANARLWPHLLMEGQKLLSSASHQAAVLSIGVAPVQRSNEAQAPGVPLQLADPGADRT